MPRLSTKQAAILSRLASIGGTSKTIWELAAWDYRGRGHAASYARIHRLAKRGLVQLGAGPRGARTVTLTERGSAVAS